MRSTTAAADSPDWPPPCAVAAAPAASVPRARDLPTATCIGVRFARRALPGLSSRTRRLCARPRPRSPGHYRAVTAAGTASSRAQRDSDGTPGIRDGRAHADRARLRSRSSRSLRPRGRYDARRRERLTLSPPPTDRIHDRQDPHQDRRHRHRALPGRRSPPPASPPGDAPPSRGHGAHAGRRSRCRASRRRPALRTPSARATTRARGAEGDG